MRSRLWLGVVGIALVGVCAGANCATALVSR
jgi:hypothetical protein